ncbi:MAG: recombinase family protein [Rhodobacteraceae bacterium]|nr:recombinase family protein [Paracoccaceae bacterium]
MKTIAYLRVSMPQQDAGSQRLSILEYARIHGLQIDDFVEATTRGQATAKRRRFGELIGILDRGDHLPCRERTFQARTLARPDRYSP